MRRISRYRIAQKWSKKAAQVIRFVKVYVLSNKFQGVQFGRSADPNKTPQADLLNAADFGVLADSFLVLERGGVAGLALKIQR